MHVLYIFGQYNGNTLLHLFMPGTPHFIGNTLLHLFMPETPHCISWRLRHPVRRGSGNVYSVAAARWRARTGYGTEGGMRTALKRETRHSDTLSTDSGAKEKRSLTRQSLSPSRISCHLRLPQKKCLSSLAPTTLSMSKEFRWYEGSYSSAHKRSYKVGNSFYITWLLFKEQGCEPL